MADRGGENAEKNYREEAIRIMERAKELQEQASSLNSKMRNEEQSLCQRVATIDSDIRRFKSSIEPALRNGIIDPRDAEKLEEEMYKVKCIISDGDISALLPSKVNGRFLKMFLGPINVRATRKDIQLKVKEEYNSFRVDISNQQAACEKHSLFIFGGIAIHMPIPTERILDLEGNNLQHVKIPIKVAEIMLESPGKFVLLADEILKTHHVSMLLAEEELLAGKLYLLFPVGRVNSRASQEELRVVTQAGRRKSGARGGGAKVFLARALEEEIEKSVPKLGILRAEDEEGDVGFPGLQLNNNQRQWKPVLETITVSGTLNCSPL